MNPTAIAEWTALLTGGLNAGAVGVAAVTSAVTNIKAALAEAGIQADTAQLDFVIADAPKRQAREDAILNGD